MTIDNMYGFDNSDNVELDELGLPLGLHLVAIIKEEPEKDSRGVVITCEILDGLHKGKTGSIWFNTREDIYAAKIGLDSDKMEKAKKRAHMAQQEIKRIAMATGRGISATAPMKDRVLKIEVAKNPKDARFKIYTYLPKDHVASSAAPF